MKELDIISELGPLAFGSRLRRLNERLAQDVTLIYREQDIDFEPRWFGVFCLLARKSPMAITDIARILGVSHPAVNQIASEMMKNGLISELKDETDKRKRLLALTPKGKAMTPMLQRIWDDLSVAVQQWLDCTGVDVLDIMAKLETALDSRGLYSRFLSQQELSGYVPPERPYYQTAELPVGVE